MIDDFKDRKYKLAESENFDEFMSKLGVGYIMRKAVAAVKPVVTLIKKADDTYVIKSESTFKNTETEFTVGKEFDEATPDGRTVKAVFTIDGNTIKEVQTEPKEDNRQTFIDRTFDDEHITMTMKVVVNGQEVHAKRVYKHVD